MEFSRKEYKLLQLEWVAIPFSREFLDPVIEPESTALQGDSLPSEPPGKPNINGSIYYNSQEPYMQNRKRDPDVQNRLLNSVGEGKGGIFQENSIETCILSRVKQITSPGWMHETSAQTWCTGKTQRDQVEREVGEGIGMGNTCKSMADSFQCMTKPTTIL